MPMPPRTQRVKTGSVTSLPHSVQTAFQNLFAGGQVSPAEIDKSIYDSLGDFDEMTQLNIIERFATSELSTIKNKTGFFIRFLKQAREARKSAYGGAAVAPSPTFISPPLYDSYGNYATGNNFYGGGHAPHLAAGTGAYGDPFYDQQRPAATAGMTRFAPAAQSSYAGFGPVTLPEGVPGSFYKMAQNAQTVLANMYNSQILQPNDLDECVFDSVAGFPESEQTLICDGFAQSNLSRVRNRTAFFIGILKRHRQVPGGAGGPAVSFGAMGRDAY